MREESKVRRKWRWSTNEDVIFTMDIDPHDGFYVLTAVRILAKSKRLLIAATRISQFVLVVDPRTRWSRAQALKCRWVHWLRRFTALDLLDPVAAIRSGDITKAIRCHETASTRSKATCELLVRESLCFGRLEFFQWHFQHCDALTSRAIIKCVAEGGFLGALSWIFALWQEELTPEDLHDMKWKTIWWAPDEHRVDVVRLFHEDEKELLSTLPMNEAAARGDLQMVQWLHEHEDELGYLCTTAAMNRAAANGYLDIVKWLHKNRSEGCTTDAMDLAAANGYLRIVKWLHRHHKQGCTSRAMDLAAANGYLAVVQWLHDNRSEGCTTDAMDVAAANGYLVIVQWLTENRTEGCTTAAMDQAAAHGYFDIVQWLHKHRVEGCTVAAMDLAAAGGFLGIVQWLDHNREEACTTDAMDLAAANGHLDVVMWLHRESFWAKGCTVAALDMAAANGHYDVMKWLHSNRHEGGTRRAMDMAATNGHIKIVRWLDKCRLEGCSMEAMDGAASNGHLEVVRWLNDNRTEGCTANAMDLAARNGHLKIVEWLHSYRSEGCTQMAFADAAVHNHWEVVKWFVGNRPDVCIASNLATNGCWRKVDHLLSFLSADLQKAVIESSVRQGKLTFVAWIHDHYPHLLPPLAAEIAAANGDLDIVRFHHESHHDCSTAAMDLAAKHGHLDIVKFLHENRQEGCTTAAMDQAAANGHLDVVMFLHENREEGCSHHAIDLAAGHGQLEVIEFLHHYRHGQCSTEAMDQAAQNGHLQVVDFLHRHRREGCTYSGLIAAIRNRHVTVVEYLYDNRPELASWPQKRDVPTLIALMNSEDEEAVKILHTITARRKMRYQPTISRAPPAKTQYQVAKKETECIWTTINVLKLPDALGRLVSEYLAIDPAVQWNEFEAAKRGWVHWLSTFSRVNQQHLLWAAAFGESDGIRHIHERLASEEGFHCGLEFMGLLMARGKLQLCKWHLEHCDKVSFEELIYIATWSGQMDMLNIIRSSQTESKATRSALVTTVEEIVLTPVELAAKQGDREGIQRFFIAKDETLILEAAEHGHLTERKLREPTVGVEYFTFIPESWANLSHVTLEQMRSQFLGNLDAVQRQRCTPIEIAARHGHLDVVALLASHPRQECTSNAIDLAAIYGHLSVVEWLTNSRTEGCTLVGYYGAIRNGYIDIVRYLFDNYQQCRLWPHDDDLPELIRSLWDVRDHEMVEFFRIRRQVRMHPRVFDLAVFCGDEVLAKRIHNWKMGSCTSTAMDIAIVKGDWEAVRWLNARRPEGCSVRGMDGAAEYGDLEMLKFLHEERHEGCSRLAMDLAAKNGHKSVVEFLHSHQNTGCSPYAICWATWFGHYDIVQFLLDNGYRGNLDLCIQIASARYFIMIEELLRSYNGTARPRRLRRMSTSQRLRSSRMNINPNLYQPPLSSVIYDQLRRELDPNGALDPRRLQNFRALLKLDINDNQSPGTSRLRATPGSQRPSLFEVDDQVPLDNILPFQDTPSSPPSFRLFAATSTPHCIALTQTA